MQLSVSPATTAVEHIAPTPILVTLLVSNPLKSREVSLLQEVEHLIHISNFTCIKTL